jgi:hypothetical protein
MKTPENAYAASATHRDSLVAALAPDVMADIHIVETICAYFSSIVGGYMYFYNSLQLESPRMAQSMDAVPSPGNGRWVRV